MTVAFGSRDRVLPGVARRRDELPDQTRWVTLSGCGHVPMFDDPQAVVDLLLRSTDPDTAGTLGKPVRCSSGRQPPDGGNAHIGDPVEVTGPMEP